MTTTRSNPDTGLSTGTNADPTTEGGRLDGVKAAASNVADGAASIAREVPGQLDQVATTTGQLVGDAQRAIEGGSDEALMAGTVLTTGLALGLLIGRAPRLAVAMALVPAAAMGASLMQRRGLSFATTSISRPTAN